MSDLAPSAPHPTRQQLAAQGRTAPGRVTGKLKAALGFMVWEGLKRPDAAAKAGLTDHGLREALRRPHVKAAYMALLEVLRTSERARNIHALVEVRDDPANKMARVQAVKALEQLDDAAPPAAGNQRVPGFLIVVERRGETAHSPQIEAKPLILKEGVYHAK